MNVINNYPVILFLLVKQEMYVVQHYFALCFSSVCTIYESTLYITI